jgi:hypothetical protein
MNQKNIIKISLSLAAVGCVITLIGDVLMLGAPMSGSEYFRVYKTTMINTSFERLLLGNTLGLFVTLELFGFWALYLILKQNSKHLSAAIFFCFCLSMIVGIAYHSSFAFYGSGLQVDQQISNEITGLMIQRFNVYHNVLYILMGLFYAAGSFLFVILVLREKTVFKKWQAVLNPLALLAAVRLLLSIIPMPVGGYIAPGYGNITNIVFFSFLLYIMIKIKWDITVANSYD